MARNARRSAPSVSREEWTAFRLAIIEGRLRLGAKLRAARTQANVSQSDVAFYAGVSQGIISHTELGYRMSNEVEMKRFENAVESARKWYLKTEGRRKKGTKKRAINYPPMRKNRRSAA